MKAEKIDVAYWKQELDFGKNKYIVQYSVRDNYELSFKLKIIFSTWALYGSGYDHNTEKQIYLFSNSYSTDTAWQNFVRESEIKKIVNLKEIK